MTLTLNERNQFNSQMKRTYKKVFSLAYRLSGNRSDAEDLTQEAFYRAYRSYESYEGDKPFENWIFRIVTRLFLDLNRARKRRVKTVSSDATIRVENNDAGVFFDKADERPGPEDQLLDAVVSEEMEESLLALNEEQRRLIWMADIQGMPYGEIASLLKAPVGTIRSRLHRAHKQLREALQNARRVEPCMS